MSMSRVICKLCNDVGHESKYCTESWRQYHNIVSSLAFKLMRFNL